MGKGESGQVHGQFPGGLQPQAGRCAGVDACVTLWARAVDYFSRSQSRTHGLWFPEPLVDRGRTAVIWEAAADVPAWSRCRPGVGQPCGEAEGRQGAERPGGVCMSTVCASVCRALGGQAWTFP